MSEIDAKERAELTIRLETGRPIEVSDLGRAFQALGKQYEDFVVAQGYDHVPGNAQLYVTHLETGSIIATLQTMLDQASFVLEYVDVLAGFVTNLNDIINFFLRHDKATPQARRWPFHHAACALATANSRAMQFWEGFKCTGGRVGHPRARERAVNLHYPKSRATGILNWPAKGLVLL